MDVCKQLHLQISNGTVCLHETIITNIEDRHFNKDASLLDAIDAQDPHYMDMRTDRTTYTGNRYYIVNKKLIYNVTFCCFARCVMWCSFLEHTFQVIEAMSLQTNKNVLIFSNILMVCLKHFGETLTPTHHGEGITKQTPWCIYTLQKNRSFHTETWFYKGSRNSTYFC